MNGKQSKRLRNEAAFLNDKITGYVIHTMKAQIYLNDCHRKVYKIYKKYYKRGDYAY